MSNQEFIKLDSAESPTVNELQKEDIRMAILKSISITPYYKGLEVEACKAISSINKFSDGCITEELLDTKSGDKYRKIANQ